MWRRRDGVCRCELPKYVTFADAFADAFTRSDAFPDTGACSGANPQPEPLAISNARSRPCPLGSLAMAFVRSRSRERYRRSRDHASDRDGAGRRLRSLSHEQSASAGDGVGVKRGLERLKSKPGCYDGRGVHVRGALAGSVRSAAALALGLHE
jgi:hypothetical protein